MPRSSFEIGTTLVGRTNVELLATPLNPPKSTFTPWTLPLPLGDGRVRGGGWAKAEWIFPILTAAERDQLRTFCPGASAEIFIRTRTNESNNAFAYFSGVMLWPQEEQKDWLKRLNLVITFQRLVEVTP